MKQDWSKAPEWANYAAMDKDGEWYWYENEPIIVYKDHWSPIDCRYEKTEQNDDFWKATLDKRP